MTRTISWKRLGVLGICVVAALGAQVIGLRVFPVPDTKLYYDSAASVRWIVGVFFELVGAAVIISLYYFTRYAIPAIFNYFFPKTDASVNTTSDEAPFNDQIKANTK